MQRRMKSGKISSKGQRAQRSQNNGKVSSLELLQMQAAHQAKFDELLLAQQEQQLQQLKQQQQQQQQQQQPTAYSQRFNNGAVGIAAPVSPYSQFTNAGQVAGQTPLRFAGGAVTNQQQQATQTGGTKAASNADSVLQQHVQRIQQELAQHQGKVLLPPQAQQPPSYAEQMQAAYQGYLQQQRLWDQQQQQLLHQLYESYPHLPSASSANNANGQLTGAGVGGFTSAATRAQPQSYRFNGGDNRFGFGSQQSQAQQAQQVPAPFYTTQQHLGFMQQQHGNVLRDQQNVMRQQYIQDNQANGMAQLATSSSYSPASQVSHVNYSSGNVNYTF